MMTIEVSCSKCGAVMHPTMNIEEVSDLDPKALKERIEADDWVVQFNGDYMDTYCSQKCAK